MKNILKTAILILLAIFAGAAIAADAVDCPPAPVMPTVAQAQAAMKAARDHGFLWSISKDGRTSYLFGTIHVAKMEWMFPGPQIMQALRTSDAMALELDMADADIMQRMSKAMAQQQGTVLPAPLAQRMQQQMQRACISQDAVKKMIPEMQVILLVIAMARRDGVDPTFAIDAFLANLGHGSKMTVVSLETPESQLDLLKMPTPQATLIMVERSLDDLENGQARALTNKIVKVWEDADYNTLEHYKDWCNCLNTEIERKQMARLLDERNPAMAERIDTLHSAGQSVFAAVGSLHMVGDAGLPALLKKRGYLVERIDLKP
ncbi:MAG: TraB/GumN family protein [Methylophilaceae bacterium]|nr:TraB/GumN family protein [Methylophilaceae bacterium]